MKKASRIIMTMVALVLLVVSVSFAYAAGGSFHYIFKELIEQKYGYITTGDWMASETSRAHLCSSLLLDYVSAIALETSPVVPTSEHNIYIGVAHKDSGMIAVVATNKENDKCVMILFIPGTEEADYSTYKVSSGVSSEELSIIFPNGFDIVDPSELSLATHEIAALAGEANDEGKSNPKDRKATGDSSTLEFPYGIKPDVMSIERMLDLAYNGSDSCVQKRSNGNIGKSDDFEAALVELGTLHNCVFYTCYITIDDTTVDLHATFGEDDYEKLREKCTELYGEPYSSKDITYKDRNQYTWNNDNNKCKLWLRWSNEKNGRCEVLYRYFK